MKNHSNDIDDTISNEVFDKLSPDVREKVLRLQSIKGMFFNTPLLEIEFSYKNKVSKLYAKYEAYNFTGSTKDRVAYYIFLNSYLDGSFKANDTVVEATSGNMGLSFSALAKFLKHEIIIVMPDWLSQERYALMGLFGVKMRKFSKEEGGFLRCFEEVRNLAKQNGIFYPDQFSNKYNTKAHKDTTSKEICDSLKKIGKTPELFVAGVGTGGTVMGMVEYCVENKINCISAPIEPISSPTITTGGVKIGTHRIQGISDEFIPPILKVNQVQPVIQVDDGDSIVMAQMLNSVGLSVGISSGANFLGCVKMMERHGFDKVATTYLPDSSFKYLSTDLCKVQEKFDEKLTDDIKILGYRTV